MRRGLILLLALCGALLACSVPFIGGSPSAIPDVTPPPTGTPFSGPPPKITIEAPSANAQAILNQPFRIRVHAQDGAGITRIEMRASDRIVASQSTASANPDLIALLEYTPTQAGIVTLQAIAFRGIVASDPASVTITIVANAAQLANPGSLDPTLNVAAGPVCTVHVTTGGLSLRIAPNAGSKQITTLPVGESLNVTGRSADSKWYMVRRASGASGWVSAAFVKLDPGADCSGAPVTVATVTAP